MLENFMKLNELNLNIETDEKSFNLYTHIIQPATLCIGIFLNVILYTIIYRNKKTKSLYSTKPLRYLLMTMLISDTWFLIDKLNLWHFSISNKINLNSINFFCQFISYLNYFAPILLESSMIVADYILLSLVFKKSNSKNSNDIYHNFITDRPNQEQTNRSDDILNSHNDSTKSNIHKESWSDYDGSIEMNRLQSKKLKNKKSIFYSLKSDQKNKNNSPRRSISLENNIGVLELKLLSDLKKPKPKKKPFVKLIESFKFKREDAYFNIILKEKFFLILNTFVWMYLLSVIFWIKGLTKLNTDNLNNNMSIAGGDSMDNICSTHLYYQRLAVILNVFLSLLKLFTIVLNVFSSLMFHLKFRNEYILSLKSTFKNDFENLNSKIIKFKNFYLSYSSKNTKIDSYELKNSVTENKNYAFHYKHLHFVRHYALVGLIYSILISTSVFVEFKNNIKHWNRGNLGGVESFKKINYPKMNDAKDEPAVINEFPFFAQNESNSIFFIYGLIRDQDKDESFNFYHFYEYTEYLAHSIKFILYLIFSVHFKFYFKICKNINNNHHQQV